MGVFFDEHLLNEGEVGSERDEGEGEGGAEEEAVEAGEEGGRFCGEGVGELRGGWGRMRRS